MELTNDSLLQPQMTAFNLMTAMIALQWTKNRLCLTERRIKMWLVFVLFMTSSEYQSQELRSWSVYFGPYTRVLSAENESSA